MKSEDNRGEIELELEQYQLDYLNKLAKMENKTVDQIVEDIIREELDEWENNNSKE